MDPIENCNPGCIPTSSTCVIWQGPNLPCISVNTGDSINIVIADLATKLCEIAAGNLDVSSLDFKCVLDNLENEPVMLMTALQLLIDKTCTLEDIINGLVIPPDPGTPGTQDPIALPACLQYTVEGELVTSLLPDAYSSKLASEICDIISDINTLNSQYTSLNNRVLLLEAYVASTPTGSASLPTVSIPCVNGNTNQLSLVNSITLIDTAICAMKDALGSNTSLVAAVGQQCTGLATATQLSNPAAQMSAIAGWVASPTTVANTLNNIWLTICDMRAAMESVITLTTPTCASVIMDFGVTLNAARTQATIVLYDFASIPSGFTNVSTSKITVGDGTRTYDVLIDIPQLANNPGEDLVINLDANNISAVSGLTFTLTGNLLTSTGEPCSKTSIKTVPFVCPATAPENVLVTLDGTNAQFVVVMPAELPVPVVNYTYTVKRLNGTLVYGPATINNTTLTVNGLSNGTTYNVEVKANYACGSSVAFIESFTTEACDSRPTSVSFINTSVAPGGSLSVGSLPVPVGTTVSPNTNCDGTLSFTYATPASAEAQGVLTINGVIVDTVTSATGVKTQIYSIPTVPSGSVVITFVVTATTPPPPENEIPVAFAGADVTITSNTGTSNCNAPIDLVFILDITGSMGGALSNLKTSISSIATQAGIKSNDDYRLGLITVNEIAADGIPTNDNTVQVMLNESNNLTNFQTVLDAVSLGTGVGVPEPTDVALASLLNNTAVKSIFPGTFRSDAIKMVILITDAVPAGFDDAYEEGVDDVRAHELALLAQTNGVKIYPITTGAGVSIPALITIMADYATTSGGTDYESASGIVDTAVIDAIANVECPPIIVPLLGSGTDSDGTITAYAWTKISGPAGGTIVSPSSAATDITDLITPGVYVYRLTVTDNEGATSTDDVQITVSAPSNNPPTANAGTDVSITLPTSTTTLTGSGTDSDGTISSYAWTKLSGPSGGTIASPSSAVTNITDITLSGVYTYRLTVTDNNGATATDDVQLTVADVPPVTYEYYLATEVNCVSTLETAFNVVVTFPTGTPVFMGKYYRATPDAGLVYEVTGTTLLTSATVNLEPSFYYLTSSDACNDVNGSSSLV